MKKTVNIFVVTTLMLFTTSLIFGQETKEKPGRENKKENFEKIEAAKKEYFTQELKLTDKESERFWSIYDEYKKSERENRKNMKKITKEFKSNLDSIPENDVKSKMETIFELEKEEIELKKRYYSNISDVVGYKRATKALRLEREFKKELMERVNKKPPHEKEGIKK